MEYFLYQDQQRLWRWMLFAADDAVIAKSVSGHSDKQNCRRDIPTHESREHAAREKHPTLNASAPCACYGLLAGSCLLSKSA